MVSSGSDLLTIANWGFSVADIAIVLALVFAMRYVTHNVVPPANRSRARVHMIVGTFVLLLYGLLGLTTATGALLRVLEVNGGLARTAQIVAVGFRAGILIALAAWVFYTLESVFRGRYPKIDHVVDKVLGVARSRS